MPNTLQFSYCPQCLAKQLEIDRLREELERLKDRLHYQERTAQEGPFGSSTPSSKVPVKPNSSGEDQARPGGARQGHPGHGRPKLPPEAGQEVKALSVGKCCPDCGGPLKNKGQRPRTVIDLEPLRRKKLCYQLQQKYCPHCHKLVGAQAPGVLGRNLLGNGLLTQAAIEHYLHGVTLGHLENQLAIGYGTLIGGFHQLAKYLEPACEKLVQEYRQAPVKQADETSWRTDGHNGYAWLFCTPTLSLYRFRQSRTAQIANQILGPRRLPGVLVVDRYQGYNQAPCALQYCYAHLLREVQDLEKEFPEEDEVRRFVGELAPRLARAMHLRTFKLPREKFLELARQTRLEIKLAVHAPARHPGIQRLQNLFREKAKRLYHWVKDPKIPADNNRSERELRPLVIARKVSFGSQSEAGAHTREVLMSILHTLRKRTKDVAHAFEQALNRLASNPSLDPYKALFGFDSS